MDMTLLGVVVSLGLGVPGLVALGVGIGVAWERRKREALQKTLEAYAEQISQLTTEKGILRENYHRIEADLKQCQENDLSHIETRDKVIAERAERIKELNLALDAHRQIQHSDATTTWIWHYHKQFQVIVTSYLPMPLRSSGTVQPWFQGVNSGPQYHLNGNIKPKPNTAIEIQEFPAEGRSFEDVQQESERHHSQ